jgi:RecA-family ATPase
VLDTRARCTLGLEENSASEQGRAIAAADKIRNAADCSVLAVHHTPRTGNAGRGSNAWDGAVWSDLRIEGSKLAAKVHCEKQQGFIHNVGTARRSRWARGKNRPPWLPENG